MVTNKMKHAWTVVLSSFLVTFCCSTTSAVHFAGRQVPSLQPSANPSRPGPAPDACTAGADVCPPAPPAGDKAVVQGLQAGISVQYSCIDNYVKIDGQEQLNCISGAWNGKPLRCGAVCRDYGNIQNGFRNLSGTTQGSVVTFGCQDGFTLVGNKALTCGSSGLWVGAWPECLLCSVNCGDPLGLGAQRLLMGTTQGSAVNYSCTPGYTLLGSRTRTCLPTGMWSGTVPSCSRQRCAAPLRAPTNGFIATVTSDGCNVTYRCNNGFLPVGSSVSVYTEMGWSNPPPTCIRSNCPSLANPDGGEVNIAQLQAPGDVLASYHCRPGYQLVGKPSLTCKSNSGYWNDCPPTCQITMCSPLSSPRNGQVRLDCSSYGCEAVYTCAIGYSLAYGDQIRTCTERGWSGTMPSCVVQCKQLKNPDNGVVSVACLAPGSKAVYTCAPNYSLSGQNQLICQNNGEWSGDPPKCKYDCGKPPAIQFGVVDLPNGTTVGSLAVYRCKQGYINCGPSARVVCQFGGWSGNLITCSAISSCPIPTLMNGSVNFASTSTCSVATYQCNSGFRLLGPSNQTCVDGRWVDSSSSSPVCKVITCDFSLTTPSNGSINIPCNTVGCMATYSCNNLSVLVGNSTRVCQPNGLWSGNSPVCQSVIPTSCNEILLPPGNGSINVPCNTVGCTATYSCNNGSVLVGNSMRGCQINGLWSGSSPMCQIITVTSCNETLLPPGNGSINVPCNTIGCIATYSCNILSVLVGNSTRVCQSNGLWNGSSPMCQAILCNEILLPPENGSVNVPCNTFGCRATYSCNNESVLVGNLIRECQINGVWSGSSPMCQIITVTSCNETLLPPGNGSINVPCNTIFCMATYFCNNLSVLVGNSTRVCQPNGLWSGNSPVCQSVIPTSCNEILLPPRNGSINVRCNTIGCMATYSCNNLSVLVGNSTRVCQPNGLWSDSSPTCQVVICNEILLPPSNGSLNVPCNTFGCMATYSCNNLSVLVGNSTRVCQPNGLWSDSSPTCQAILCNEILLPPENGSINVPCNTVGCTATYSCNNLSVLVGNSTRVCQPNGLWGESNPTCELVTCPLGAITSPQNGHLTLSGNGIGDTATYSCAPGFVLSGGSSVLTCGVNGMWSGVQPTCQVITCPDLTMVPFANGKVFVTGRLPSDTATYICNSGFMLQGTLLRTCSSTGMWTGAAPFCIQLCPNLVPPVNGKVTIPNGNQPGSQANYVCNSGFRLIGAATRTCQNGAWSDSDPTCQLITCPDLTMVPFANGKVFVTGRLPSDTATYICNSGFILQGTLLRTCSSTGMWTGAAPFCIPMGAIQCPALDNPANGSVIAGPRLVGTIANYSCNQGNLLEGSSQRVCQQDGTWMGDEPFCLFVDCGPLPAPSAGSVSFPTTTLGAIATYSCFAGYVLGGTASRQCGSDGTWNGMAPTCTVVDCGKPPSILNGIVTAASTIFNATAFYTCSVGYKIRDVATTVCTETGSWSTPTPVCVATGSIVDCGVPPSPTMGSIQLNATSQGSIVTYQCQSGFMLNGASTRTCLQSGQWSGQPPSCVAVTCPGLPSPLNGKVLLTGMDVNKQAFYSCNDKFTLIGQTIRICLPTGSWSGNAPLCAPNSCPDPGSPNNGHRTGTSPGFPIGSSVFFVCKDGFAINGTQVQVCQAGATWSNVVPSCTVTQSNCTTTPGTVIDQFGRLCTCVNAKGNLGGCPRYREVWTALSSEQRQRYITAVKEAASNPTYSPLYNSLVASYKSYAISAQSSPPIARQLLPVNRYFMLQYEDILRALEPGVTIPVWDWTITPSTPYINLVFDPVMGFGNAIETPGNVSCVSNGPFQRGLFSVTPSAAIQPCLMRLLSTDTRNNPTMSFVNAILAIPANNAPSVLTALSGINVNIPCTVGGDMCSPDAANDPLYLLHQAMLDSILTQWQSNSAANAAALFSGDSTPLALGFDSLTVSDISNNTNLPYGVSVTYST